MDLPDELEYLPYRLKGLEVDELTELLEGCGFLSDAGCSLNISLIADSMRRRIFVPDSAEKRGLRDRSSVRCVVRATHKSPVTASLPGAVMSRPGR